MPGEGDEKVDRAANRRARFLAAMQAAESAAQSPASPQKESPSFKGSAARRPAEIVAGEEEKLRMAREEIARQFRSQQDKGPNPPECTPATKMQNGKSLAKPLTKSSATVGEVEAAEDGAAEAQPTKEQARPSTPLEATGTSGPRWKRIPAGARADVGEGHAYTGIAHDTLPENGNSSLTQPQNPKAASHDADEGSVKRILGGAIKGLSLFESMRDEAAEAFVSRLGPDGGARHLRSSGRNGNTNRTGGAASDMQDPATRSSSNMEIKKQQAQAQVLSPKFALDHVPVTSTTVQGVRLDQDWENMFSPPKYTFKMRREREAEILRQRMLLSDYSKMQMHLDSHYSRFQLAMKNEERQMDRWKDALGQVRQRVEKQCGQADSAGQAQPDASRQAKWDSFFQRIDDCLQIIEQTGMDNEDQHQQSVSALKQHELLHAQVKEMLESSTAMNGRHQQLPSQLPGVQRDPVMTDEMALYRNPEGQMAYIDSLAQVFAGPVPYQPANAYIAPSALSEEQVTAHGWAIQLPCSQGLGPENNSSRRKSLLQAGIGMLLAMDPEGNCMVDAMVPRGPADSSGKLKIGDRLLSVDGAPVTGRMLHEITPLFLGAVGTPVFLAVDTGAVVRTVQVVRGPVEVPLETSNDFSPPPRAFDNPFLLYEIPPAARDNPFRASPPQPRTFDFSKGTSGAERAGDSVRELRDLLIREHAPHANGGEMGPMMSSNPMPFDMRMEHRLGMEQKFLDPFSVDAIGSGPGVDEMLSRVKSHQQGSKMETSQAATRMRIALLTHGWSHDIEPFEQMVAALIDRGHVVYIAAPERWMPRFQNANADWFIPLENDPAAIGRGDARAQMQKAIDQLDHMALNEGTRQMGNPCNTTNGAAIWLACAGNRAFCAALSARARAEVAGVPTDCRLPAVDWLIFHVSLTSIAMSVCEVLSIPAVGVVTSSQALPTLSLVDSDSISHANKNLMGQVLHRRNSWGLQTDSDTLREMLFLRQEMVDSDLHARVCVLGERY